MRKYLKSFLILLSALCLCSCSSTYGNWSKNGSSSIESPISQTEGYKFHADAVNVDSIYEYRDINIPTTINNLKFHIIDIYDDESLFVVLEDAQIAVEVGVYNFVKDEYNTIYVFEQNYMSMTSYNENYYIFKEIDKEDKYGNLYYYDISNNTINKFFEFSANSKTGNLASPNYNKTLLIDNTVYFDDYSYDENNDLKASLYSYNITDNKTTLIKDNAQLPLLYNNQIISFIKNEKGEYKKLHSLYESTPFDFIVNDEISDIVTTSNSIFALALTTDFEIKQSDFKIKDMINDKIIMSTASRISDLKASESFISWCDYTGAEEEYPCLFDIEAQKLVIFNNMDKELFWFYVKDDYGIVCTREENYTNPKYCFFKKK